MRYYNILPRIKLLNVKNVGLSILHYYLFLRSVKHEKSSIYKDAIAEQRKHIINMLEQDGIKGNIDLIVRAIDKKLIGKNQDLVLEKFEYILIQSVFNKNYDTTRENSGSNYDIKAFLLLNLKYAIDQVNQLNIKCNTISLDNTYNEDDTYNPHVIDETRIDMKNPLDIDTRRIFTTEDIELLRRKLCLISSFFCTNILEIYNVYVSKNIDNDLQPYVVKFRSIGMTKSQASHSKNYIEGLAKSNGFIKDTLMEFNRMLYSENLDLDDIEPNWIYNENIMQFSSVKELLQTPHAISANMVQSSRISYILSLNQHKEHKYLHKLTTPQIEYLLTCPLNMVAPYYRSFEQYYTTEGGVHEVENALTKAKQLYNSLIIRENQVNYQLQSLPKENNNVKLMSILNEKNKILSDKSIQKRKIEQIVTYLNKVQACNITSYNEEYEKKVVVDRLMRSANVIDKFAQYLLTLHYQQDIVGMTYYLVQSKLYLSKLPDMLGEGNYIKLRDDLICQDESKFYTRHGICIDGTFYTFYASENPQKYTITEELCNKLNELYEEENENLSNK